MSSPNTANTTIEPRLSGAAPLFALVEMPMPSSGPVKIIRENIKEHFGATRISQHGGGFRMWSDGDDGFKVTLDPLDALWIIDELGLGATNSTIFRRSVTWANAELSRPIREAVALGRMMPSYRRTNQS